MADAVYTGNSAYCPACTARVQVSQIGQVGGSIKLKFYCERCHERGYFHEDHLAAMNLEWSPKDKNIIEDTFWTTGAATCTIDRSTLNIIKGHVGPGGEYWLKATCPRCGRKFRRTKSESEAERGTKMSSFDHRYEFIRAIASGGMGQVSLVRERETGKHFAAKTIKPEYLRDADAIRRFQREKRVLSGLNHPNIVQLHEAFMDEHGGVFVMDYMPNGDLGAAINNRTVTNKALADLFDSVAAGVDHIHQHGIAHRDLKPGNVLIDDTGNARVSDFGLAVLANRDSTTLTLMGGLGTLHYAAPEQIRDAANVDHRADIYALGFIAYEMATRESPWAPPVVSTGDPELDEVLKRSIARDRERRTATTQELARALRGHLTRAGAV